MFEGRLRLFLVWLCAALFIAPVSMAVAQQKDGVSDLKLPGISSYATPKSETSLALGGGGAITLSAQLTDKGSDITRGIVWRVFKPEAVNGKLPMVASAHGGTAVFQLEPGSYLVHASYDRAGATKRITVGKDAKRESLVLDAGGLKLDAVLSGGDLSRGECRHSGISSVRSGGPCRQQRRGEAAYPWRRGPHQ